ncbi:MAG: exodeoxyribonuclease VII large subunit [Azospira sp.]|jgi:exodeoxyribonuclease VII large subunit|nr:exodeoxyribonuclease VII large subunit [Azospira sp.]
MPSGASPLTVSALNRLVRERLESGFPLCRVTGEISNLTVAASGHAYFTLKDESAQVRCVMFRNRHQLLGWRPANGQHVEARVLVTLYEARGDFQLNVESLRRAGVGNLFEQFQKLKERLEAEGLFAAESKRPLPAFPRRIGIVTSLAAAALRDVLTTLRRRAPQVAVTIFPTPVQGEGAGGEIAAAITTAGESGLCDALIVCRGGGSIEDLWAFNDEAVARAMRACPVPVVSGVGHETDFTIADFAADLRAPTPTAAAEIVAPERARLRARLAELRLALSRQMQRGIERRAQSLDGLARRLTHPAERLARQRTDLAHLALRLRAATERRQAAAGGRLAALDRRLALARPDPIRLGHRLGPLAARLDALWRRDCAARAARLAQLAESLAHLNPQAVLGRGYALVQDAAGGIVRDAAAMEPSATIHVYLAHGRLDAEVRAVDRTAGLPPADT